jgi:hypothetical protein
MRAREKQNKHKLKFTYIAQLQILGKIWKDHSTQVSHSLYKKENAYNHAVIKLMSESKRKEYCSILDRCDDILLNVRKVDGSLKKSHRKFSKYKDLILNIPQ